jgi:hypothetical protein
MTTVYLRANRFMPTLPLKCTWRWASNRDGWTAIAPNAALYACANAINYTTTRRSRNTTSTEYEDLLGTILIEMNKYCYFPRLTVLTN